MTKDWQTLHDARPSDYITTGIKPHDQGHEDTDQNPGSQKHLQEMTTEEITPSMRIPTRPNSKHKKKGDANKRMKGDTICASDNTGMRSAAAQLLSSSTSYLM